MKIFLVFMSTMILTINVYAFSIDMRGRTNFSHKELSNPYASC